MSRIFTASENRSLIRLASLLPVGSKERKILLAHLAKNALPLEERPELGWYPVKDVRHLLHEVEVMSEVAHRLGVGIKRDSVRLNPKGSDFQMTGPDLNHSVIVNTEGETTTIIMIEVGEVWKGKTSEMDPRRIGDRLEELYSEVKRGQEKKKPAKDSPNPKARWDIHLVNGQGGGKGVLRGKSLSEVRALTKGLLSLRRKFLRSRNPEEKKGLLDLAESLTGFGIDLHGYNITISSDSEGSSWEPLEDGSFQEV